MSCPPSPARCALGGLACALLLSACAESRPAAPPAVHNHAAPSGAETLPPPDRPDAAPTAEARPAPPPLAEARVLRRDHLVALALAANPELTALAASIDAARARARQAAALPDPRLGYRVAPFTLDDDAVDDGHVVTLSQRLPWAGKRAAAEAAELAGAEVGAAELAAARRRLARRVVADFDQLWAVARRSELVAAHGERVRELERLAERRLAVGGGSLTDPIQAEEALVGLEHRLVVLAQRGETLRAALNAALHRPVEAELPPVSATATAAALPEAPALAVAVAEAWAGRPELAALRRQRRGLEQRLRLARLSGAPDVTLEAGYNSLWREEDQRFTLGIGLDLPIQRGRVRGAVAEQEAALRRLDAEMATRRDAIAAEVAAARAAVVESRHVLALFDERHLPLAEERLAAARGAYEAGRDPFDFLIAAERHLLDTELARAAARATAATRWVDLQLALGRAPAELEDPLGLGVPAQGPDQPVEAPAEGRTEASDAASDQATSATPSDEQEDQP